MTLAYARLEWIQSKKPADTEGVEGNQHHTFWLKGYGSDKAKDDKMIESNCYKTLNYLGFWTIIRSVANEVRTTDPGPVEVGNLTRRHWDALKEPTIIDI